MSSSISTRSIASGLDTNTLSCGPVRELTSCPSACRMRDMPSSCSGESSMSRMRATAFLLAWPRQGLYCLKQITLAKRFQDVAPGPGQFGASTIQHAVVGRHQHHRNGTELGPGTNQGTSLKSVKVRHHDVHEDDVRPQCRNSAQGIEAILCQRDLTACFFENLSGTVPDGQAVIDKQDLDGGVSVHANISCERSTSSVGASPPPPETT